ncbi:MAG: CDP-alcohol phosphatidyltransferase family protein [Prevotella sp.]
MKCSNGNTFSELLQASFKSNDTEEWLDVHFTRPIGLVFALFWNRFGVHPNVITILSIFLGIGAGYMFAFTDLWHNLAGVVLLMFANFCDSTDGQMARLTGKKTLIGRMLDGFSGDVWFFCIYAAIAYRLMDETIPFTDCQWGLLSWVVAAVAGILCHSPQSSLSDYYRQIHLFFLKGKGGSELDNYAQQRAIYESLPKSQLLDRVFYYNYSNYCKSQEKRTPMFQKLFAAIRSRYNGAEGMPEEIKQEFLAGSRPLMPLTNILTFNTRAICIYVTALIGLPLLYLLFEITVMQVLYVYMHRRHEKLCEITLDKINRQ